MPPVLYFVVPCYKDADVIPVTGPVFAQKLDALVRGGLAAESSRVLLVNDGSPDGTWDAVCALAQKEPRVSGIGLAENCGEKYALLCGMEYAVGKGADCVITADSDLQDDIGVAPEMLRCFSEGSDIVLGVRSGRAQDPLSERFFSKCFYILMRLMRTGLVTEHSNFRLMSAKAVREMLKFNGAPFFMPALASTLPLPKSVVYYERTARAVGVTSYSFRGKFRLAAVAVLAHSAILPKLSAACAAVCAAILSVASAVLALSDVEGTAKGFLCAAAALGAAGAAGFGALFIAAKRLRVTPGRSSPPCYRVSCETRS